VGRHFVEILEQTATWTGMDGNTYYLNELDDDYLGNIIAYLNRHAARLLQNRRDVDKFDVGTHRVLELEGVDPLAWLHDRPLYCALLALQRRRGALDAEVVPNARQLDSRRTLEES
jgi:hypothetical protein